MTDPKPTPPSPEPDFHGDASHPDHAPSTPRPAGAGGPQERGEAEVRGPDGASRPGGLPISDAPDAALPPRLSNRRRRKTGRRVAPETAAQRASFTSRERLLILDTWLRSKLPAKDFSGLVRISQHTLYKWKHRFEEDGPAGLEDRPKGPKAGSRLSDETQRAILMMKQQHPEWGEDRIHAMLSRTQGLGASPGAIGRYLEAQGYEVEQVRTKPHPDKPRRFERARPNQLWQTDLFTFVLKRQNRRVHVVAYMDDHSRFIVGYGLHASSSGVFVRETLEVAIANHGAPEEVLTDNGSQYTTWRGKSEFTKLCERRGIKQIVARPRRPQTLGKVERFWGTLWRECVESAVFLDLDDARKRIGHFIDYYNFQRTHSGIEGLVPADRFFAAVPQVKETLQQRVDANAKELAQQGMPRKSFYLTGRVGDSNISLHAEGERVVMTKGDGSREEVDLRAPGRRTHEAGEQRLPDPVASEGVAPGHPSTEEDAREGPGESPLDNAIDALRESFTEDVDDVGDEDDEGEAGFTTEVGP